MANNSTLGILIKAQDAFSGTFSRLNSQIKTTQGGLSAMSAALGTVGIALGGAAIVGGIVRFTSDLVKLGMEAEEVRGAFENLARGVGADSKQMLGELRAASHGMTSELDLMKSANRALLADSQVIYDNLGTVYQMAALGADALGVSTTEAFDRIIKAMSAMQSRGLKEFGINIDQSQAMEDYARSIGKVAEKLTIAEQEAGFAKAAIAAMEETLKTSGDVVLSTADKVDALAGAWTDLKVAAGEKIILEVEDRGVTAYLTMLAAGLRGQNPLTGIAHQNMSAFRGTRPTTTYGPWSYPLTTPNQPSATFGGRNPQAYFDYQNSLTDGSNLQEFITEKAREEAEAKRRASEYQSTYNSRLSEQRAILDSIRSRAESVLGAGVSVTNQDMLDTAAGRYADKPLEAARRLADIAANGMASPWAAIMVPPPEVIAAGEAAVKAWAERTKQDVIDLTRPDLINWDAFIANYQDALNRETARESTLDLAMQKLDAAGLLKGADKNQVAQILGLETPQSAGEMFASGFAEGVGNKDLSNLFLSAWQTDFDAAKPEYELAGKNLGGVIITGLSTAVKDNMPNVRQEIAYYIAPEVAKILAQKDGAKP